MKEPLGRIHPHGSGGKSVYQRAAQEANDNNSEVFDSLCRCFGFIILGLCGIGFIVGLASSGSAEIGAGGLFLLGIGAALYNS